MVIPPQGLSGSQPHFLLLLWWQGVPKVGQGTGISSGAGMGFDPEGSQGEGRLCLSQAGLGWVSG